jgi:hypothetical protein
MRTHRIVALAGVMVVHGVVGCASEDSYVSMGADATTRSSGGTSSGGQASATGGKPSSSGGSASSTGGKASATGGKPSSSGGSASSTGGKASSAGGKASGGTAGSPGQDPGPTGIPISLCPDEPPLDDISVVRSEIEGDRLTVTVQYGGGCEQHDIALCYSPSFGDSDPPYVDTRFLHDANGDTCEALITETLVFDLSPLSSHGNPLLQTRFGMYASGELSCWDRFMLVQGRLHERARPHLSCSEDADCVLVSDNTACALGCGLIVSASAVDVWDQLRSRIDEEVCGPFTEAGCPQPVAACEEPVPACVQGQCRAQDLEP